MSPENTVLSSLIADAQITYTGKVPSARRRSQASHAQAACFSDGNVCDHPLDAGSLHHSGGLMPSRRASQAAAPHGPAPGYPDADQGAGAHRKRNTQLFGYGLVVGLIPVTATRSPSRRAR